MESYTPDGIARGVTELVAQIKLLTAQLKNAEESLKEIPMLKEQLKRSDESNNEIAQLKAQLEECRNMNLLLIDKISKIKPKPCKIGRPPRQSPTQSSHQTSHQSSHQSSNQSSNQSVPQLPHQTSQQSSHQSSNQSVPELPQHTSQQSVPQQTSQESTSQKLQQIGIIPLNKFLLTAPSRVSTPQTESITNSSQINVVYPDIESTGQILPNLPNNTTFVGMSLPVVNNTIKTDNNIQPIEINNNQSNSHEITSINIQDTPKLLNLQLVNNVDQKSITNIPTKTINTTLKIEKSTTNLQLINLKQSSISTQPQKLMVKESHNFLTLQISGTN